jgi:hypothetical protein
MQALPAKARKFEGVMRGAISTQQRQKPQRPGLGGLSTVSHVYGNGQHVTILIPACTILLLNDPPMTPDLALKRHYKRAVP